MLQARSVISTEYILENWGRWASGNAFSSLCYPSIEPFRRMYSLPGDQARSLPPCNEELAKEADGILAKMIFRNEEVGVVTALYFITGLPYSELKGRINRAKNKNYSQTKIHSLVGEGISWFDGAFMASEDSPVKQLNSVAFERKQG